MTKEQKLLQSIDNLEAAIEVLEAEHATPEALQEYRDSLAAALRDLAVLRHTRRQKGAL